MKRLSLPFVLLAASLLLSGGATSGQVSTDDLAGCWVGYAELEGSATPIRVGLSRAGEALKPTLSVPAIGMLSLPAGTAVVEADGVTIGSMSLKWTGTDTLSGAAPKGLDPVDHFPVTFRRTAWLNDDCSKGSREATLETAWEVELDEGVWADPTFDPQAGILYLGTLAGQVVALETKQGGRLWSFSSKGSIRSSLPRKGQRLYAVADDGMVAALSTSDGKAAWSKRVAGPLDPPHQAVPGESFHFRGHQLLVSENGLLVGTLEGRLLRLDPETGDTQTEAKLDGAVTALAQAKGGPIYAATMAGTLYSFSRDLSERWRFAASGPIHGDLLVGPTSVFFGDRGYYRFSVNAESGRREWKRKLWFSWVESGAQLSQGVLYFGSSDAKVVQALNPVTGTVLWSTPTQGWAWATPVTDGRILVQAVAAQTGYFAEMTPGLLILDPITGQQLARRDWQLEENRVTGIVARPVLHEDTIMVVDTEGVVSAYRVN